VIDAEHKGAHPVSHAQVFLRDHFGTRQAGFDLAGFDNGIALVHALDRAGHDGFATFQEVVQHLFALGVADLLQDRLLGGLRADTAELDGLERFFDVFADLDVGHDLAGIGIHFLLVGFLQPRFVRHDQPTAKTFVAAAFTIDGNTDVRVFLEALFHGRSQRAFQRSEHHFARHVLFARKSVDQ
jgi:hypothetical protein